MADAKTPQDPAGLERSLRERLWQKWRGAEPSLVSEGALGQPPLSGPLVWRGSWGRLVIPLATAPEHTHWTKQLLGLRRQEV